MLLTKKCIIPKCVDMKHAVILFVQITGFHEAVGDVLALSVSTPKHLKEVGLIDSYEENYGGSSASIKTIAFTSVTVTLSFNIQELKVTQVAMLCIMHSL